MAFDNKSGFGGGFNKGFGSETFGGGFGNGFSGGNSFSSSVENSSPIKNFFSGTQNRVGVNGDVGRMQVERLVMVPAGSYYNQHYRPLTAHARRDNIDLFAELTENGTKLSPSTIARANFDFITPSARASSEVVPIANGWDTARFSFIMRINATLAGDVDLTYLLFGYTSHVGCSVAGNVDPNMELFFTRCISVRNLETRSTFGLKQTTPNIAAANNILFRNPQTRENLYTLRPEDILGHAALPLALTDQEDTFTTDTRNFLSRSPKFSKMIWSNPNVYLSRSLQQYASAINAPVDSMSPSHSHFDNDRSHSYERLLSGVQDESPVSCAPLQFLRRETSWGETMCVRWKELASAFPEKNREEVSKFQVPQPAMLAELDGRIGTDNNNGAAYEHIIASRISQELPAMLIQNQLISIQFSASNESYDNLNRPMFFVENNLGHMTGGEKNINASLESFKCDFLDLIFMALSKNNQVSLTLNVKFSIYGNCSVNVNYNHNGFIPFNLPVFAESATSMMVSNDPHSVNNLSSSLSKLMEVVEVGNSNNFAPKFGNAGNFGF